MRRHVESVVSSPGEEEPPPEFRALRPRSVARTVCAAAALFSLGSLMLFFGVQALRTDRDRGIAMCTVGALAFLPGSYASYTIFGAWMGWPEFAYDSLPSYDD
jgi:hypothetical protein